MAAVTLTWRPATVPFAIRLKILPFIFGVGFSRRRLLRPGGQKELFQIQILFRCVAHYAARALRCEQANLAQSAWNAFGPNASVSRRKPKHPEMQETKAAKEKCCS
jgi:hypothetical protein